MSLELKTAAEIWTVEQAPGSQGVDLPKNLQAKVLAIMADAQKIEKRGYNEHHKYTYAMAADVVETIRAALVEHRVTVTPGFPRLIPIGKTDRMAIIEARIPYTVKDLDSGESVTIVWRGWGADAGDKAPYKAYTGTLKYFLLAFFMLPIDPTHDPEFDRSSQNQRGAAQGASQRRQAPPQSQQRQQLPRGQQRPAGKPGGAPGRAAGVQIPHGAKKNDLGLWAIAADKGDLEHPKRCGFCGANHITAGDVVWLRMSDKVWGSQNCYRAAGEGDPPAPGDEPETDLPFDRDDQPPSGDSAQFPEGEVPTDWENQIGALHPVDVFPLIESLELDIFGDPEAQPERAIDIQGERNQLRRIYFGQFHVPEEIEGRDDEKRRLYLKALVEQKRGGRR